MSQKLERKSASYINGIILHWIAAILLIIFFIYRYQDIHIPYCSDEMDVYAQGVLYMYDHQPSLAPRDIPTELSRGHPLLFFFLASSVFKAFGPTLEVAHTFSLIITTLWCIMIFLLCRDNFSLPAALSSLVIVVTQPMVISQSTMLLPEVLLALMTIGGIYFYLRNKDFYYALFVSLAVLTKESAIVLPTLVLLINLIPGVMKIFQFRTKRGIFPLIIPLIAFVGFFVIQKIQNGWVFFPLHTDYMTFAPQQVFYKFFKTTYFFVIAQGRFILSIVFLISLVFYFRRIPVRGIRTLTIEESKILFLVLFIFAVIAFSIVNFYNNRYYLLILGPLFIVIIYFIEKMIRECYTYLITLTILSSIPFFFFLKSKNNYNLDVDLSYKYMVENQLEFFEYLDKNNFYKRKIFANHPFYEANLDPRFGYVKRRFNFTNNFDKTVEYVAVLYLDIFNYWEPPKDKSVLVKTFTKEYSTIKLFKVTH